MLQIAGLAQLGMAGNLTVRMRTICISYLPILLIDSSDSRTPHLPVPVTFETPLQNPN
jgi:hypothetical protein